MFLHSSTNSAQQLLSEDEAYNCLQLGIKANSEGQLDTAISYLGQAHLYYSSLKNNKHQHNKALAAYFLGASFKELKQWSKAKIYLELAFDFYLEQAETKLEHTTIIYLINCALDLAFCFLHLKREDKAVHYLEKIKDYLPETDDPGMKANIANIYLMLAEYSSYSLEDKLTYYQLSQEIRPSTEKSLKIAIIHFQLGAYEVAKQLLRELLINNIDTVYADKIILANSLYHLARCEIKLGQPDLAVVYLSLAKQNYQQLGNDTAVFYTDLAASLASYKAGLIEMSNSFLRQFLEKFQLLKSSEMIEEANQVILESCQLVDFSQNFNLTNPLFHTLNQLYIRILEMNYEDVDNQNLPKEVMNANNLRFRQ